MKMKSTKISTYVCAYVVRAYYTHQTILALHFKQSSERATPVPHTYVPTYVGIRVVLTPYSILTSDHFLVVFMLVVGSDGTEKVDVVVGMVPGDVTEQGFVWTLKRGEEKGRGRGKERGGR